MQIKQSSSPAPEGNIIVCDGGKRIVIALNALVRIESRRVYTVLHIKGREEIVWTKHLGSVETFLPEDVFVKIHRSHVINIFEIRSYIQGRGGSVILSDNTELKVAQRRKSDFLRRLDDFTNASKRAS